MRYLIAFLFAASMAFAQGGQISGQALVGGGVPNARIRVCAFSASPSDPCTPTVAIYSDPDMANDHQISNPTSADAAGNYSLFTSSGKYTVQISGSGVRTFNLTVQVPVNLDSSGLVPAFMLGTGATDSTTNLRGDRVWDVVSIQCRLDGTVFVDVNNNCGWPGTTPDAWITNAASSLGANGGKLSLGPGVFTLNGPITINTPVFIEGQGQSGPSFAGPSPTPSTFINCGASSTPACFVYSPVSGATNAPLKGGGLSRVAIICNSTAPIGLQILSTRFASFTDLFVADCTSENIDVGVVAALADARDTQNNRFDNISSNTGSTAATQNSHAYRFSGDATANVSGNVFRNMTGTHCNGHGFYLLNTDDNYWENLSMTRGGGCTGIDIYLHGNGVLGQSPREEVFSRVTPSVGGYVQDGSSTGSVIHGYSTDNGGGSPTVTTGALLWTQIGVNSSGMSYRITRETGSDPNVLYLDSSTAGLSTFFSFNDAGAQKWLFGKETGNGIVLLNHSGYNAIGAVDGGNTSLDAADGAFVVFNKPTQQTGTAFGSLGTPADGTTVYCPDCTFANPCAGGGTGAIAKRLNGAWRCD